MFVKRFGGTTAAVDYAPIKNMQSQHFKKMRTVQTYGSKQSAVAGSGHISQLELTISSI